MSRSTKTRGDALDGSIEELREVRVVPREAVDDAGSVGIGLQSAEAPDAGVAEGSRPGIHRKLKALGLGRTNMRVDFRRQGSNFVAVVCPVI